MTGRRRDQLSLGRRQMADRFRREQPFGGEGLTCVNDTRYASSWENAPHQEGRMAANWRIVRRRSTSASGRTEDLEATGHTLPDEISGCPSARMTSSRMLSSTCRPASRCENANCASDVVRTCATLRLCNVRASGGSRVCRSLLCIFLIDADLA